MKWITFHGSGIDGVWGFYSKYFKICGGALEHAIQFASSVSYHPRVLRFVCRLGLSYQPGFQGQSISFTVGAFWFEWYGYIQLRRIVSSKERDRLFRYVEKKMNLEKTQANNWCHRSHPVLGGIPLQLIHDGRGEEVWDYLKGLPVIPKTKKRVRK